MKIINCAPRFDDATHYSFEFNRKIVQYAREQGHEVIDLTIEEAVRERVEEALRSDPEAMMVHYDHGGEDRLYGNDHRAVVDLDNVDLLSGRESYNMNCLSAKVLGAEAHRRNCKAYWGNVEVVSFTTDAIEQFEEAFNLGFKLRVQNNSWEACLSKVKQRLNELIDDLIGQGKFMAAWCIRSYRDSLVCYNGGSLPPEPKCFFRRLAVKLFGPKAWRWLRA